MKQVFDSREHAIVKGETARPAAWAPALRISQSIIEAHGGWIDADNG
jgi:hypothetical protein